MDFDLHYELLKILVLSHKKLQTDTCIKLQSHSLENLKQPELVMKLPIVYVLVK